VLKQYVL